MKMIRYIQYLLIRWIVGKRPVGMNLKIKGEVFLGPNNILIGNKFT